MRERTRRRGNPGLASATRTALSAIKVSYLAMMASNRLSRATSTIAGFALRMLLNSFDLHTFKISSGDIPEYVGLAAAKC